MGESDGSRYRLSILLVGGKVDLGCICTGENDKISLVRSLIRFFGCVRVISAAVN